MILNELAVNSMTEEDVIRVIKRSCELRGAKLLKVNYNRKILSIIILIEGDIDMQGEISLDIDGVLCGFVDSTTFELLDNELADDIKGPCPNTTVMTNRDNYNIIAESNGGVEYEF